MYRITLTHRDGTETVHLAKEFSYNTSFALLVLVYNHHTDMLPINDILKLEVYNNGISTLSSEVKCG